MIIATPPLIPISVILASASLDLGLAARTVECVNDTCLYGFGWLVGCSGIYTAPLGGSKTISAACATISAFAAPAGSFAGRGRPGDDGRLPGRTARGCHPAAARAAAAAAGTALAVSGIAAGAGDGGGRGSTGSVGGSGPGFQVAGEAKLRSPFLK